MKLNYLKAGDYRCIVEEYNTKTSTRTGYSYINLQLVVEANGKEVRIQKSYCLDVCKKHQIMVLLKSIGGLKKKREANFEMLYQYEYWASLDYDDYGNLVVTKLEVAEELEDEESSDDVFDTGEEEDDAD